MCNCKGRDKDLSDISRVEGPRVKYVYTPTILYRLHSLLEQVIIFITGKSLDE